MNIIKISGDKSLPLIKAIMDLPVEQRNIFKGIIQITVVDGAELTICNPVEESLNNLVNAIKEFNNFYDNLPAVIEEQKAAIINAE